MIQFNVVLACMLTKAWYVTIQSEAVEQCFMECC